MLGINDCLKLIDRSIGSLPDQAATISKQDTELLAGIHQQAEMIYNMETVEIEELRELIQFVLLIRRDAQQLKEITFDTNNYKQEIMNHYNNITSNQIKIIEGMPKLTKALQRHTKSQTGFFRKLISKK